MKILGRILLVVLTLLLLGYGYWRYDHADRESKPTEAALAALASDEGVEVIENEWYIFKPRDAEPSTGLIFYPGGEVDERGYAQPLHEIAAAGYLVVMVPMPLQLAVFDIDAAAEVVQQFPEIQTWAIAGHSLGGSMAAVYAADNMDSIAGLLLWDSYAPGDMTASPQHITMIHRADDSGNPPPDYMDKLPLLPEQTQYLALKGGQHLNFGSFVAGRMYRNQPEPDLNPDQQRAMVAEGSVAFLESLD